MPYLAQLALGVALVGAATVREAHHRQLRKSSPRASGHDNLIPEDQQRELRHSADRLIHFLEVGDTVKAGSTGGGNDYAEANATAAPQKMPPYDEYLPQCLAHVKEVVATIDEEYTDVQIQTVLTNECLLEKQFPSAHEDGFESEEACHEFARMLTEARNEELNSGSQTGYQDFCKTYYDHKVAGTSPQSQSAQIVEAPPDAVAEPESTTNPPQPAPKTTTKAPEREKKSSWGLGNSGPSLPL